MATLKRPKDFRQSSVLMSLDFPAPGFDAFAGVAATGTLTADTKANSTDLDYYILNDGQAKAMLWYNVAGTTAAKYAKVAAASVCTLTCDTKANTANEGYATIFDGKNSWDIMMDTDASGDSTGNAHIVVDVSGATTAADIVALIVADVNSQAASATFDTPEEVIHFTAAAAGNDVVFTSTVPGYQGNGTCSVTTLANAWAVTNMIAGVDAFPAEEFAEVDISGATTEQDVMTVIHGVINALTEVKITSTDPADGNPLTLANDEEGSHGNTAQVIYETGSTLMALTDMTGGANTDESGATAAIKLFTVDHKKFRVDRVELIVPAGYTQHAANYWTLALKAGATTMASYSTATAAEGTIAADTLTDMTLSATAANQVADQDDVISMSFTKAASAVDFPLGRIVIHGRHL